MLQRGAQAFFKCRMVEWLIQNLIDRQIFCNHPSQQMRKVFR